MTEDPKQFNDLFREYKSIKHKDALVSIAETKNATITSEPIPTNEFARMRIYDLLIDEIDNFFTDDLSWSSQVKVSKDKISIRRI